MADILQFPSKARTQHDVSDAERVNRLIDRASKALREDMDLQRLAAGLPTVFREVLRALLVEHDRREPEDRATIAITLNVLGIACAQVERALAKPQGRP